MASTATSKSGTVVQTCNCKHAWQDKQYGVGRRVHNRCKAADRARCSVCGVVNALKGTAE